MKQYLEVLKKYAVFEGRAHRAEYWIFLAISLLIFWVLFLVNPFVLARLYGLAVFLPTLAVGVRRLHDTGRSGWYMLMGLVPIVGPLVLIFFMVLPGQAGGNPYGQDPTQVPEYIDI
jgi:uncharacterized membrane protein YhaH (DUF805 family)